MLAAVDATNQDVIKRLKKLVNALCQQIEG